MLESTARDLTSWKRSSSERRWMYKESYTTIITLYRCSTRARFSHDHLYFIGLFQSHTANMILELLESLECSVIPSDRGYLLEISPPHSSEVYLVLMRNMLHHDILAGLARNVLSLSPSSCMTTFLNITTLIVPSRDDLYPGD